MTNSIRNLQFEKVSPSLTQVFGTHQFMDGDKRRKVQILVGMITDLSVADRASEEMMENAPYFEPARRYLALVYNHPRMVEMSSIPGVFECRAAFSYKPSRTQAADFIKEYFGVPTVRRGDD